MGGKQNVSSAEYHVCHLLEINPSQWKLLEAMLQRKNVGAVSCRDLQEGLGLDSSYVSRTLTRLMNKGLVSRKYVFVANSPPRYRYTPISKTKIEHILFDAISLMKLELQSVDLCVSNLSDEIDGNK